MTRILRFKNPCLQESEFYKIVEILPNISTADFDKTTWQNLTEYYYISDEKEISLTLELLQKLCRYFPVVVLDEKQIIIKNVGGRI